MEAKLMKILAMLMLFCLCNRGNAESPKCTLSDLHVTQKATGKNVGGYPEYSVEVVNGCSCTQVNVKLLCPGFYSSERVNPSAVRPDADGKLCTFNDGVPVFEGFKVKFNYASGTKFSFAPFYSAISCWD